MNRLRITLAVASCIAIAAPATDAATIIKLGFSTDSLPDIEMLDNELSTFDDDFGATIGDQNTEVTFLDVLSGAISIEGDRASFTLSGVNLTDAPPAIIGSTLVQGTTGGNFVLYDPQNEILLSGTLGSGTLSGPFGGTATGGFLTTEFGSFTGGSLLSILDNAGQTNSSVSISLTNVNDGRGLSVTSDDKLAPFTADATANIGALAVPEPSSGLLAAITALATLIGIRYR